MSVRKQRMFNIGNLIKQLEGIAVPAIMSLCLGLPCLAEQAPDASLVAYYSFEEGPGNRVKDWSGNNNNGLNMGAKYIDLGEEQGFALRFDTKQAHVNCGNKPSFNMTEALTMELWFYPETATQRGEPGLLGRTLGDSSYTLSALGWFYISIDGAKRMDCPGANAPLNKWNHIVVTFDGRHSKIYVDGRLRKSMETGAEKQKISPSGGLFYLRYPSIYGVVEPLHKCMMDDVRIYSRALTEEEITSHYRNGAGDKGKDVSLFSKVKLSAQFLANASMLIVEADFSAMEALLSPGSRLIAGLHSKVTGKNGTAPGRIVARYETSLALKSGEVAFDELGVPIVRQEGSRLQKLGKIEFDWNLSREDAPAGDYELIAIVKDKTGARIGASSSMDLKLARKKSTAPDWETAYNDTKMLNSLVGELLNINTLQTQAEHEYTFKNPREGWVFFSLTAAGAYSGANRTPIPIQTER